MEQKVFFPGKVRPSRSAVQVEDDVHFVLDNNSCFPAASPIDKSFESQRKTYAKKIPVVYQAAAPSIFGRVVNNTPLKDKVHSSIVHNGPSVPSGSKIVPKKRKSSPNLEDSSKCLITGKFQKRTSPLVKFKNSVQNSSAKLAKNSVPSSSEKLPKQAKATEVLKPVPIKVKRESSDSEIEIVAVKVNKPVNQNVKKISTAQSVSTSSFRKRSSLCFDSEPIGKELLINEADPAPFMPTNPNMFPDVGNKVNSMRWLSANGSISVTGSGSLSSFESSEIKTLNDDVLHLPEMKVANTATGKPKPKSRELKKLYDNLNEITWTKEASFKKLLRNPNYIRHSERAAVKVLKHEKSGRTVSPKTAADRLKTTAPADIQKKNKNVKLNSNIPAKEVSKAKLLKAKARSNKEQKDDDDDDNIKYKLAPGFLKAKTHLPKVKKDSTQEKSALKLKPESLLSNGVKKMKPDSQKVRFNLLKPKQEDQQVKTNGIKLSPDSLKLKNSSTKSQLNGIKTKSDSSKLMPFSQPIVFNDSPPSTSGTQGLPSSSENYSKTGSSEMKGLLKKFDSYGVAKEIKLMKALGSNGDIYSAVRKGSKLRVRLEPLEHTSLWSPEFYEEFRKHMLDQALRKALESHDHDSVSEMYQELFESFSGSPNNNKVLKKKKTDEEALRISVRQSEGAFRYKEIVVKKHPNYMQVVLVPNMVKQNSLTNEALKELKDAFLLAKKDPNCRAVLLNSSGTYFCTGIDLSPLIGSNKRQVAEEISNSIKDLVVTLATFTKPVIAAVNGACLGFGVALLTYCDIVLASDKATFCLPATKIGYLPEGGVTLTLPQVVGSVVASEMLIQGRRLTADQAMRSGLVSEVLWPTRLMNEVIPRLKNVISQPLTAMEATKTMVRCHLWDKLKTHVERERRLLCEHWQTSQCQANIKTLLQTGWLVD